MFVWIAQNFATIFISLGILAVVILIVAGLIRKHKSGKSISCGCDCGSCPGSSLCQKH